MRLIYNTIYKLLIICIVLSAASIFAAAEDEAGITVYNTELVTNNLDATFIEGEVPLADGQDIVVLHGILPIARKTLPETGRPSRFRIKIPATEINADGVTSIRVKATEGKTIGESLPVRAEITYKPREKQKIETGKEQYKLTLPGLRESLDAKTSSGSDIYYVSSDADVVDVDEEGNLIPKGKGKAKVAAKTLGNNRFGGAETSVNVSVDKIDGYLVAFHSSIKGEEDQVTEQILRTGESAPLTANSFENGDHSFLGWATEDEGLVEYADTQTVSNLAEEGETVDLYAVWTGDGARAAVAWALKIAADDSFNYGYKPMTATPGCYFCGTNRRNKPSGYEKTYVCMTFVHAAFAHGTEDPEMLADCQRGKYTVSLNDWNFSHWSCWKKIGRTRSLSVNDLKPGDVIIWWADDDASGHASLYAGNGDIVDAAVQGWGANSIAVRKGAAARYLRRGDSRSYVMRYVGPNA